jgi:hypothetical protein
MLVCLPKICYALSMTTLQQTVEIPADHRLILDVPWEVPSGPVILTFTPAAVAGSIDPRLKGAVSPELYGKGEINGDIIGPFFDEWGEQ